MSASKAHCGNDSLNDAERSGRCDAWTYNTWVRYPLDPSPSQLNLGAIAENWVLKLFGPVYTASVTGFTSAAMSTPSGAGSGPWVQRSASGTNSRPASSQALRSASPGSSREGGVVPGAAPDAA